MMRDYYDRSKIYILKMVECQTVRACVVMTLGLCSTFIGYEYARAASITLLAAEVSLLIFRFFVFVSLF